MGTPLWLSTLLHHHHPHQHPHQHPHHQHQHHHHTILLLYIALVSALASPNAVDGVDGVDGRHYRYESIVAPLLRALSDHGEARWDADASRAGVKAEPRYMRYMTEVYRRSPRVHRSVDGRRLAYNTLRLIKPLDTCLDQRDEISTQDLSYNLDRVGPKESLLKSVLLYSFDLAAGPSNSRVCYVNIKEQEYANECQLCPGAHLQVNFTVARHTHSRHRQNWVEVDITPLLLPLFKFHKRAVNLRINLTCSEGLGPVGGGAPAAPPAPVLFLPKSPPLLLYLNDTRNPGHQRSPGLDAAAGQGSPMDNLPTLAERCAFRLQQTLRRKRRRRRASLKTKQAGLSLDHLLPELLPSSEDCTLYDFKVRFSQLELDHWIVFPPKYNPRYCRGICQGPMGIYRSPIHTMVQKIIYEKFDTTVPRPACIPSHYSPLSVMILEEDGSYVYKQFDKMVATRCTCR